MGPLQDTRPTGSNLVYLADRVPSHLRRAARQRQQPIGPPGAWARMAQARASVHAHPGAMAHPAGAPRPAPVAAAVRVTHFAEAANAHGTVRRLRICGRLADVCAELERLAAAEERQAALPRRA